MNKRLCFIIGTLLLLAACNKDKQKPKKTDVTPETAADSDTGRQTADQTATDSGEDHSKDDEVLSNPISPTTSNFAQLAIQLEQKRQEMKLEKRELLAREQMVARLEQEALSRKEQLSLLKEKLKLLTNKLLKSIENKYNEEQKKIDRQFNDIKMAQKEFIHKELASVGLEGDNLTGEVARLVSEREKRIGQLTSTIEGMNAQSGALMLTSMEVEDAIPVLRGLSSTKSAELFAAMPPATAASLATGLLGPRVHPVPTADDIEKPAVDSSNTTATAADEPAAADKKATKS